MSKRELPSRIWVVMVTKSFGDMEVSPTAISGLEVRFDAPAAEPYWYLPVFESYEAAVRWNGGPDGVLEAEPRGPSDEYPRPE